MFPDSNLQLDSHGLLRTCKISHKSILPSHKSGFDEVFEFSNSMVCKVPLFAELGTA
jgi:hypothetical protein